MAKTLIDFRAEHSLYLKDVAEKTGIPEDELRTIEASGKVPPEIADILINDYYLPDTYFSEIVISSKVQPKSPMKYFFGVSFVYSILISIAVGFPLFVKFVYTFITSFSNMDFTTIDSTVFNIFDSIWASAVYIISCIMFANFVLKRTHYTGDVKKYQFLHYAIPNGAVMAISMLSAYMTEFAYDMLQKENIAGTFAFEAIGLLISLAVSFIAIYVQALLLKTAIEEDKEKKFKTLKTLAIIVTVSCVIAFTLTILSNMIFERSNPFVIIRRFFVYGFCIATSWTVALTKNDDEKKNKIAFTILPLISILQPIIFSVIDEFI